MGQVRGRGNAKILDHLEDLILSVRVILNYNLKEYDWSLWNVLIWPWIWTSGRLFKQDNEPSNDTKFGEFRDCLRKFQLPKILCVSWNWLLRTLCQYEAMPYHYHGSGCTNLKATAPNAIKSTLNI